MNIVIVLVLLLCLGATAGQVSSIDMHDLSFSLCLAATTGTVMLVALGIRYRNSRVDIKISAPIEPLVEAEPEEIEQFKRNTIAQITAISAVVRNCATTTKYIDKPVDTHEKTGSPANLLAPGSVIETPRNAVLDKHFAELLANIHEMAKLTARLNDKRKSLDHTTAAPVLAADNTLSDRCYLSFTLRDQPFAVSTLNVCGVVEATQLITRPDVLTRHRRAIKLRGTLVPVIDLGAYLGEQPLKISRSTNIIILEVTIDDRMQMIGVVVDAVSKVAEIPPREIEPREAFVSKIHNDFTLGTITVNNHTVTLLDIGRGLLASEFVVLRSTARSEVQENLSRG
ncbi:chemotaxis protein CheW [Pseudomonas gingeri]|uniref:chemotaxis protein CheW n=1 Tax=Pseudomonas gingeri TaxID=117681 RepID=UPI0015A1E3BA|nr:chemotaxis protein CheW [Pseudomonas gingeri]NVZ99188.1 chemotaxis protein CheW [Pseudomonas gingeri]NWA13233.1 chemotaxis protein CheW [Pseudomonas gingeri]NWA55494.1 chemotaxis protein CheW [Pseudomonas gingeri]NWA95652.1 chemotaxis protein CheW [Pseudomonas gingeri]NWB00739.1 chemotaxis protein CheW [Pseudomonas gingeri]